MVNRLLGRVSIEAEDGRTLFVIPAKKSWVLLFLAFWLAGWSTAGPAVVFPAWRAIAKSEGPNWFVLLWSVGWVAGFAFAAWSIAWGLGGKEFLRLTLTDLELTKTIFGMVIKRRLTPLSEVRNLRYVPASGSGRRSRESSIRYEDSQGTVSFGAGLDDGEALAVIERMLAQHPFPKKDRSLEYLDFSG